ncbi:MAG: MFS transporter [Alphaproteobacteria bacterium]|nr:MFS transporter [Alphaproteobacteria bacterium]
MAKDKYIAINSNVSGYSFANLGLFTGFASGVYNAVYSLVVLGIFTEILANEKLASSVVGVYVALYSVFCMIVGLFSKELLRWFSKARLMYVAFLLVVVCYAMMSFSVKPTTFITLDFTSGIGSTIIGILIPLFMADFSKDIGMAKLNARYYFWVNIGALVAPLFALNMAAWFGNYRIPFLASAMIYAGGLLFFKRFGIVQADKEIKTVSPRRTFKSLWLNTLAFFRRSGMPRSYFINFGFYALAAMRVLYVPIVVVEQGFSANVLGWVLTLGIVPYIIFDTFIGNLVKKVGAKTLMVIGVSSFVVFATLATFLQGVPLLAIFVLWQISGAFMEPVHDLFFFDNAQKSEQSRFYGVFRTTVYLPKVIAPILGAACIAIMGTTSAVWFVPIAVGVMTLFVLLRK